MELLQIDCYTNFAVHKAEHKCTSKSQNHVACNICRIILKFHIFIRKHYYYLVEKYDIVDISSSMGQTTKHFNQISRLLCLLFSAFLGVLF